MLDGFAWTGKARDFARNRTAQPHTLGFFVGRVYHLAIIRRAMTMTPDLEDAIQDLELEAAELGQLDDLPADQSDNRPIQ
jgi:hypothetical protein